MGIKSPLFRKDARSTPHAPKTLKGQGLVEFALVSVILFVLILGIIELAWFLFTYSQVSNAAQEGSRYGIAQPRNLFSATEADLRRAQGENIPTWYEVPDGQCNVVDRARGKVQGITATNVQVEIWYDTGNGVPIPLPTTADDYHNAVARGNRIVVETHYDHHFIVPLFDRFAPDGLDVRMRAARTIQRTILLSFPNDDNCTMGSSF